MLKLPIINCLHVIMKQLHCNLFSIVVHTLLNIDYVPFRKKD
jgi:hypothetical protein